MSFGAVLLWVLGGFIGLSFVVVFVAWIVYLVKEYKKKPVQNETDGNNQLFI